MIKVDFDLSFEQILRVKLDASDLTGREKPTSLKDALIKMEVENPCVTFAHNHKEGKYRMNYNLTETAEIAGACNLLSELWQYDYIGTVLPDQLRREMSPLQLLENAFTLILKQQRTIDRLKSKGSNR